MPLVRDRALVLRRFPFSESSLVARVLTREHGRVHLLARGAHRPRSRYFALLDLFDTLAIEWSESPRRELQELRAGEMIVRRRGISSSLERYRAGVSMLELCDLGSRPGQADTPLYELLALCLDRLADPRFDPSVTRVVFELGFLQAHGLAPALEQCASCGGEAPPAVIAPSVKAAGDAAVRAHFSAGAGGRLCSACVATARAAGQRVGTLPLDVLAKAAELSHSATGAETFPPEPAGEEALVLRTRDFVERFLDYHLETRPRSHEAFLSAPNRNARHETP